MYELYPYLGARMHFQKIYSDLDGIINKLNINSKWAESMFGIQNQFTLRRWFFILAGDYGEIFISTKYSSQIQAIGFYRMGGLTSLIAGWILLFIAIWKK